MQPRAIFIGATGQDVGKTTLCLGLLAGLRKRFGSVGFIKPVGQQHQLIGGTIRVDKDALLFKEYFGLSIDYSDMSPIIIPSGFTRAYIDQKIDVHDLAAKIQASFFSITARYSFTLVEGTGHLAVGSIIDLSNVRCARLLGLDMLLIASGGLGKAFDELVLNIELCLSQGVRVRGVILNRVEDEKREMVLDYFPRALARYNIPLIGCIPYVPMLSHLAMKDFEQLFELTILAGRKYAYRHFRSTHFIAGSLETFLQEPLRDSLIITPASRTDILRAVLEKEVREPTLELGLLLTGPVAPPEEMVRDLDERGIPTLYVPICSFEAMKKVTHFIAKINGGDRKKIEKAIEIVENHLSFDLIDDLATPLSETTQCSYSS